MIESRWTPSNAELVMALKLQYPEVKTGRALIPDLEAAFPVVYDDMRWFTRVPDAYVIRRDDREVDIFEAEVTHAIPLATATDITRLWFELDGLDIRLSCYVINRYGHINHLDLEPWYYTIRRDVADGAGDSGFDREDAAFITEVMARQ